LVTPNLQWLDKPPAWMDDDTRQRYRLLYEIQQRTSMTLPELGLRFLLQDSDFATVIPGAANIAQLEENVKCSMAGPLPVELYAELDSLGKVFSGLQGKDY
jgi:aryl-alcohol dehydrogenase-like predicted oxidoreductase